MSPLGGALDVTQDHELEPQLQCESPLHVFPHGPHSLLLQERGGEGGRLRGVPAPRRVFPGGPGGRWRRDSGDRRLCFSRKSTLRWGRDGSNFPTFLCPMTYTPKCSARRGGSL